MRAGFQPLAADLFADADLRAIATATRISPYPEGLLDWLRAIEPPAWLYTGALENHPELVDQMAWIAPLLGNPGDVLARVRSPWELAAALKRANLLFPETRASADGLPHDGSWLTKSYAGASGSGVRSLEIPLPFREGLGERSGIVYQRRVHGIPCAAVYVAAGGAATLLGVTRQIIGQPWLGAHGFQYAGSIGPWPISDVVHATLIKIGAILASEFELAGLFGIDCILRSDDVWVLEVNPRYTASVEIVERATGTSAVAEHVQACGGINDATPVIVCSLPRPADGGARVADRTNYYHGKALLFAKRGLEIPQAFADFTIDEAAHTPWPRLADISPAGTRIELGRPILTLFADGPTPESVENQLKERVAQLEDRLHNA